MKILFFTFLVFLSFSTWACRVRIISSNQNFQYIEGRTYTINFQLRLRNAHQCGPLIVEVTPIRTSEFAFKKRSQQIPINISFENNVNTGNGASIIQKTILTPVNGQQSHFIYFTPNISYIPKSTRYNARFKIKVYSINNPNRNLDVKKNRYRLRVPPIFSIDFTSQGSTLNFGNLSQGKIARTQMKIDGNIRYRLKMKSHEGGVLKNTFNSATINYKLFWKNSPFQITKTWREVGRYPRGSQTGEIKAIIDENTSGKTDGDYLDIIEVLVETR